jgi:hypothetical protein
MSPSTRKFTAADLISGQTYRVTKTFTDYDGIPHAVGESWRFVGKDFLPYEDGLSLHVESNGQNMTLRLQWRAETQGELIDNFSDFVEEE